MWGRGRILGVDAGTTGVRCVEYVPGTGRLAVVHGRRGGRVVAALPAEHSVFRTVELPRLGKRERLAALRWELQRILPVSVDDAVFDYVEVEGEGAELGTTATAGEDPGRPIRTGRIRYAVAGAPVAAVDQRLDALRKRKIRPQILEPEWVTLWRCACWLAALHPEPGVTGVIDFGATSTRVMVIDAAGWPVVFHRSPVGTQAMEADLTRVLGQLPSAVRDRLESEGGIEWGVLQSSQTFPVLLGDLARVLRRARSEGGARQGPVHLWAIGGGARWPVLRGAVAEALGQWLHVTGPGSPGSLAGSEATGPGEPVHPPAGPPDGAEPTGPKGTAALLAALPPHWVMAGALALWGAGHPEAAVDAPSRGLESGSPEGPPVAPPVASRGVGS